MLLNVGYATFFIITSVTIVSNLSSDLFYWEIGEKLEMEPTYSENTLRIR